MEKKRKKKENRNKNTNRVMYLNIGIVGDIRHSSSITSLDCLTNCFVATLMQGREFKMNAF